MLSGVLIASMQGICKDHDDGVGLFDGWVGGLGENWEGLGEIGSFTSEKGGSHFFTVNPLKNNPILNNPPIYHI